MLRRLGHALVATVLSQSLLVAPAAADEIVNVGPNLALASPDETRKAGPVVGVEGSYTKRRVRWWMGATVELARDFRLDDDSTRWAIGPSMGKGNVRLDLRYAGEHADGETFHGVNVRLRLTFRHAGVYLGATALSGGIHGDGVCHCHDILFVEAGAQFKLGGRIAR